MNQTVCSPCLHRGLIQLEFQRVIRESLPLESFEYNEAYQTVTGGVFQRGLSCIYHWLWFGVPLNAHNALRSAGPSTS